MTQLSFFRRCGSQARALRRDGFSLVELAVVMSVASVLLTILTLAMIRIMSLEATSRSHVVHLLSISRLSDQFRKDIHQASQVRLESAEDGQRLMITLADATRVEYMSESNGVLRTIQRAGQVVGRERYRLPDHRLPDHAAVNWTRIDTPGAEFITMELSPDHVHPFLLVAKVGRHRYDAIEVGAGES